MVILSFLGYVGEIVSDSQTVRACIKICTLIVSWSVIPIFKSKFAVVDELRLEDALSVFDWPSS